MVNPDFFTFLEKNKKIRKDYKNFIEDKEIKLLINVLHIYKSLSFIHFFFPLYFFNVCLELKKKRWLHNYCQVNDIQNNLIHKPKLKMI